MVTSNQVKQAQAAVATASDGALELALQKIASVPDVRSIKSASFNQKDCAPAAHIRGLPYELIARRNTNLDGAWEEAQP